jgi:hypothetical protein
VIKSLRAFLKASVSTFSIGAEKPLKISFNLAPNFSTILTLKPRDSNCCLGAWSLTWTDESVVMKEIRVPDQEVLKPPLVEHLFPGIKMLQPEPLVCGAVFYMNVGRLLQ